MEKENKKICIDSSCYVSYGKGVTTDELIKDPTANDELWSTLETEEFLQDTPRLCQPRMTINMIRIDICRAQENYMTLVEIERMLFPEIKKITFLNEKSLFDDYEGNKKLIVKKIKTAAKEIFQKIQKEHPEFIEIIIANERYVIENLKSIFYEKLILIQKLHLAKKDVKKLAVAFFYAFKMIMQSGKETQPDPQ